MNFEPKIFPVIDLGDYVLREKTADDVEDFFAYYSDLQVNQFILCDIPQNIEDARRELYYWRNIFYQNDGIYFAIARKDNNKLIGSIGLTSNNFYHRRIELSYDLAKEYWRQGVMSRAIFAVVKYAFEDMRINRIEAFTATNNEPSKNLLLKCGFEHEGCLKEHRYHRGVYVDVDIFGLTSKNFYK